MFFYQKPGKGFFKYIVPIESCALSVTSVLTR